MTLIPSDAALLLRDQAIAASSSGIVIADARLPDMPLIYINPAFESISGYTAAEVLGRNCRFLQGPDRQQPGLDELRASLREVRSCSVVLRNYRKDGTLFWNELNMSPVFDEAGRLTHFIGVQTDITRRKLAEEALQQSRDDLEVRVAERTLALSQTNAVLEQELNRRQSAEVEIQRLLDESHRRLGRSQTLLQIDAAIAGNFELQPILGVIVDEAMARLGVDAADVLLLEPASQMLVYAAGRGFHNPAIRQTRRHMGEGNAGRAALERRTVHVADLNQADQSAGRTALLVSDRFKTYYGVPLIAKGEVQGVLEIFHRQVLAGDAEWLEFLGALASQAAIAIDAARVFEELKRSNADLARAYDTTLEGWSRALDLRDKETEGHSRRVTELTLRLAREALGLGEAELVQVQRGALLHDIGKMGVPDNILLKPGKLSDEEWAVMRLHPTYAYELLSPIEYLRPALEIPYNHHEKWDGSGYPRGLEGEAIPLAARLFAIVDVWDALRSDRPYRAAWPEAKVREHIRASAGTHFDPQLVEVFLQQALTLSDPVPGQAAPAATRE